MELREAIEAFCVELESPDSMPDAPANSIHGIGRILRKMHARKLRALLASAPQEGEWDGICECNKCGAIFNFAHSGHTNSKKELCGGTFVPRNIDRRQPLGDAERLREIAESVKKRATEYNYVCWGGSVVKALDLWLNSPTYECRRAGSMDWPRCQKCNGHLEGHETELRDYDRDFNNGVDALFNALHRYPAPQEGTHAGNPDVYPKVGVTRKVVGHVAPQEGEKDKTNGA